MIGILGSGEIWASKIQCLNDSSELSRGFGIALEAFRHTRPDDSGASQKMIELMDQSQGMYGGTNICVCSWSETSDLLSQWRAYSKNSQGYALHFRSADLQEAAKRENFRLGKCIYNEVEQRAIIGEIAKTLWMRYAKCREKDDLELTTLRNDLVFILLTILPFLKHPAFSEEREWRLVSGMIDYTSARYSIRTGPVVPIPYYRIPLNPHKRNVEFRTTIGPSPHPDIASDAVNIASKFGPLKWIGSYFSQTPLRTI